MTPFDSTVPELDRIWLLVEHHRFALAEDAARRRLAADPTDWPTLLALAAALRLLDRLTEAREAAQAAIRLAPEAADTHYALAVVRGRLGHLSEAMSAVNEALRLEPHRAEFYASRAQLFHVQGRHAEAVRCAEAGLRLDPRQADCLLWRALAQEARDQPAAADHDFARLLEVAPASSTVHRQLGQFLLRRHDPRAAEPHLSEALRQDPNLAPQLLPLLRQARRDATWPDWLLHQVRQEVEARAIGVAPGMKTRLIRVGMLFYGLRATLLTRHDPLFQMGKPPLRRPWANHWLVWSTLFTLFAASLYASFRYEPGRAPTVFIAAFLVFRYLSAREDSHPNSFSS